MNAALRCREHYCLFDTAIGACGVAWSERGVTRLQFPQADRSATAQRLGRSGRLEAPPPPAISQVIADVQRYLAGGHVDFSSVRLDLADVGPFEQKIYEATRSVGWGETATYGALARQAGAPDAARAVGRAMSRNPVVIIIPCHRILASGNRMGGFSAFGGTAVKERLLSLEGVGVEGSGPRLPGL
jgi:methylated-DNA-[protein]-cysteine S-methyltransferase